MKSLLLIVLFVSLCEFAQAQTIFCLSVFSGVSGQSFEKRAVRVGNATLNEGYTLNQFKTYQGNPTRLQETNIEGHELLLYYSQDYFILFNDVFAGFDLKSNYYKVNGCVGVGDLADKIDLLDLFNKTEHDKSPTMKLFYLYLTNGDADNSPVCFYVTDNVITRISYLNMTE